MRACTYTGNVHCKVLYWLQKSSSSYLNISYVKMTPQYVTTICSINSDIPSQATSTRQMCSSVVEERTIALLVSMNYIRMGVYFRILYFF